MYCKVDDDDVCVDVDVDDDDVDVDDDDGNVDDDADGDVDDDEGGDVDDDEDGDVDDDEDDEDDEDDDDVDDDARKIMMWVLRSRKMMILRRKTHPKTGKHTLCELTPRPAFCASLRNRNAHGHVTRAS